MKYVLLLVTILIGVLCTSVAQAHHRVTIQVRNAEVSEVFEMIAQQHKVNILMPGDLEGTISISLHEAPVKDALSAIANSAGYALEHHKGNYFIMPHDQIGSYQNGSLTRMRVYNVDYVDGQTLTQVIEDHLSAYGKVNFVAERNVLVIQDRPEFLDQIDSLMKQIDRKPQQVLIEAKILEVTLNDDENLGIDWRNLFNSDGGTGSFGVRANTAGDGFFFDLVTPDVQVALNALQDQGRLHTLSTPKLVALENQEASVVIGDRRGYQVTTTINQVTTESIEFLESGVILRVTAEIDEKGQILMSVHPEVSTGTVDVNGIPSQTTTEVTTNILVPSGETIFIGGLIKQTETLRRSSVPLVNKVPGFRRLFTSTENTKLATETVVLIRPVIADDLQADWNQDEIEAVERTELPVPELEEWVSSNNADDGVADHAATQIALDNKKGAKKSDIKSNTSGGQKAPAQSELNPVQAVASSTEAVQAGYRCPAGQYLSCFDTFCNCENQ